MKNPLIVLVALVVVGGMYVLGRANGSANAGAASRVTVAPVKLSAYYLDVGASESLGFQPTGIPHHNGARTDTGYANDLIQREAYKGVALSLEQVGCPGDTVQSVLDTTKSDACYQAPMTQLTKAAAYLQAHKSDPVLVTIDLGFNDVRPCLEANPVNEICLATAIAAIQVDLPKVVSELTSAAGPITHFVGIEYADPYLGYYFNGPAGPAEATATLEGIDRVDAVLQQVYTSAHVPIADVPSVFQTNDSAPETIANVGSIPTNVESACQLTWFCYATPFGPDDHPNNAGYSLIAKAIEAVLPKSW
ncbi:MAG: SGNH/GDSL hydrolase family protein [Acidimicrobiales bacterium]